MKKVNKYYLEGMFSTYYLLVEMTFSNGEQAEIRVGVDQIDSGKISPHSINIIVDLEAIQSWWPENWMDEVKEEVAKVVTLQHTLAMRIQQTQKTMDELGIKKEDSTKEDDSKDNSAEASSEQEWFDESGYIEDGYADFIVAGEDDYEQLLNPVEFIKNFKDKDDFRGWVMEGSIEDIRAAIKAFEKCELFEHCAIMMDVIKHKQNE